MTLIIVALIILAIGIWGTKEESPLRKYKSLVLIAGAVVFIIGLGTASIRQISPGHVGVQVLFGKVQSHVLYEGLSLVNPLIDVTEMSTQTQNYTMSGSFDEGAKQGDDAIRVLSNDGLEVVIDLTILYRVVATSAPKIYRSIGVDYQDKVIRPTARTGIRESASYFDATDLFAEKREAFEQKIRNQIEKAFKERGLVLEQMLVRNISLPASVKESIERKITAVQDAQRMKFVLEKEQQEAERKRVEARGVADAQKIVNEGLSDRVLQFETIKIQKELVTSPNAKIIILGNSKGTTPFIIGGEGK
ncbi:MAG: band 7 protein [Ignavibacteria bacterium GWB2_35_12]|nr:MAG: band 7 protein [Ignavibacteria bacterium GWA2_35_8]OGU41391.1 MAG: band 7 protein [Ignavibacteria bacterium GWB2_35_12]OGU95043.1 MAG: band 7 protein [Ignavibacteria bacterium RIFOXYA2_FULL_35_10]OGV19433.1 MAG: band 7 protein [Ignavibacteria bacterium RIFOXYC2_FULL_35_21]